MELFMEYKKQYTFDDLMDIVKTLRGENGCEWDKAQNHDSLLRYLIEESYEYIEAARKRDYEMMADELGDVLLQVALHAQIGEEEKTFKIDDVLNAVCKKMIYRHPHVFSNVKADSVDEILKNWEELKKKEKGEKTDKQILESVSKELPALIRAQKVVEKSKKMKNIKNFSSFDKETIDKLHKMLDNNIELTAGVNKSELIGQALMAIVSYAVSENIPVELCLNDYIDRLTESCSE